MKQFKKIIIYTLCAATLVQLSGCKKFLDRKPTDVLLDEQVWSDPKLAVSVLANIYNRLQPTGGLEGGKLSPTDLEEAMWSGGLGANNARNTRVNYPYTDKQLWSYDLIRDVNLFLENLDKSTAMQEADRKHLLAEGRFIRAYIYFLHVRSMGGVPLVTNTFQYDGSLDVDALKVPRSTEAGIYDFIASELDAIKDQLPLTVTSKTRANKWTVLALKSQAMLYAASIAKYNSLMTDPIVLPGAEVGIPASRAQEYYQKSLDAAKEIIDSKQFVLYNENPDKAQNFYDLFTKKANNREVIWAQDYTLDGKYHDYTVESIPRSLRENATGAAGVTPSLNLVEAFDYLDGTNGSLKIQTPNGSDYIYYTRPEDVFLNKDNRMFGSIITPGSTFRGKRIDIQAGVMEWNTATNQYVMRTSPDLGSVFADGGTLVAADGPLPNAANVTNTGFYMRKYLDSRVGSGQSGQGSDVWWIRYRFGGVLLNATEAAFELGKTAEALGYINQVRERAGFPANSLKTLSNDVIRKEFQVEMAFEEQRYWDLKRWRIAHEVYNGNRQSPNTLVNALWPYRVVRPSDPTKHNKYVFVKRVAPRFTQPRLFRLGNYYSAVPQNVINANSLIVKNPYH
ncbi:RagB/SusD family nutrient uptake outer membrane protein [Pedobacter endophyticus]|uniref:RagB/SusD family nutrient uptake outer membrane protein n=1 Tax=Pedobacter endophyticus TaxID=2789740 RepID=A0A7S9L1R8_9SPHI|nr:RagB/SusD family nutrient uptake outer membrane protein [Pedobacter endophyticus]QPH40907.1 RagB/SusD family nutrient uptake outer membrane protein [Pedobacter endophyticus]